MTDQPSTDAALIAHFGEKRAAEMRLRAAKREAIRGPYYVCSACDRYLDPRDIRWLDAEEIGTPSLSVALGGTAGWLCERCAERIDPLILIAWQGEWESLDDFLME